MLLTKTDGVCLVLKLGKDEEINTNKVIFVASNAKKLSNDLKLNVKNSILK